MKTFKDLLDRIAAVQAVPFIELARAHGIAWSPDPVRNKSLGGRIVEAAMGIEPNPRAEPDLTRFGLEIKTIPLDRDLAVLEMTKVSSISFQDTIDHEFEQSNVYHKLRTILFVPVVKYDLETPDEWYIRSPFIWMPSDRAMMQLRDDYNSVRRLLSAGDAGSISSKRPPDGQGVYMTPNTSGRDSRDITRFQASDGRWVESKRRAWMLRKDFTTRIIEENIRYRPAASEAATDPAPISSASAISTPE